jgi:biotin carboxylase
VMNVAKVRAACSIPGTSVRTAFLCRDKPEMKRVLREAGVPCARSSAITSLAEARDFAAVVGFPLILKPRDAAGAAGTIRVDDMAALTRALREAGAEHGAAAALEEFVDGHEGFYDTLAIDGRIGHEFISHYYPNVLEAMRERWISPQIVATNRLHAVAYEEVRELAARVIEVLGIGTSATHMEWFFGSKGLRFSEIGCRPPGVAHWDVYNAANEFDLYHEWAMAIVHGRTDRMPSRRYAAGIIALRPDRDGHIRGYEGLEALEQRYGDCVVGQHFPSPGTPTQPVAAGYMANAWLRMRHPDYDELRRILDFVGRTVKVHAD